MAGDPLMEVLGHLMQRMVIDCLNLVVEELQAMPCVLDAKERTR
jgi:hypothetical protein